MTTADLADRLMAAAASRTKPLLVAGAKFGEWTLLEYHPGKLGPPRVSAHWLCVCSCGVKRMVRHSNLRDGTTKSCGHDRLKKARWIS